MKARTLKRLGATLTISALLVGGLMGCSGSSGGSAETPSTPADAAYPVVYDSGGHEVTFNEAPKRILKINNPLHE